jgi:TPR repeat protein
MKTKFKFKNELASGAGDVFLGLVLFFIVLPIGSCIFLASCGAILSSTTSNTNTSAVETTSTSNTAEYVESKEARDFRVAEGMRKYQEEQKIIEQRRAQSAETERLQKKEKLERLFESTKRRALDGSADAIFSLGKMLLNGEGTETNKISGLKWIKIAADVEYGPAIEFLKER